MRGDIIVTLDGAAVAGADDLMRLLGANRIARAVEITVYRHDRVVNATIIPGERQRKVA